jgi:FdhD protein
MADGRIDPSSLPVEEPLTIDAGPAGSFTVMASPGLALELAVGFCFSEGLLRSGDDLGRVGRSVEDPSVIRITFLRPPLTGEPGRNLIVSSSCGLCGAENIDSILAGLPRMEQRTSFAPEAIRLAMEEMMANQALFRKTGGTHAAALFDTRGELVTMAEDVGRHNALDKAIGRAVLEGKPLPGCGAALSGRVSLEMVIKSARAGLELIVAVSSPTSLALEAAKGCGITLCGFVRKNRATAYTHPGRIVGLEGFEQIPAKA